MSAGVREVMDVALAPLGDDFAKARGAMEYAISARIILVDMNASLVIGARDDERHQRLERDDPEGEKVVFMREVWKLLEEEPK